MTPEQRIERAVRAVLPAAAHVVSKRSRAGEVCLRLGGVTLPVRWLNQGTPKMIHEAMRHQPRPGLVVAPRFSQAAKDELAAAKVGWVDELGAAELAVGNVIVSRTAPAAEPVEAHRWTPATLGLAEAVLTGVPATVRALVGKTGASPSTAALALRFLTTQKLLVASAARGRNAGRTVVDREALLAAYADAAASRPIRPTVQLGALWRDPVDGVRQAAEQWEGRSVAWAATGALAAAVLAPHQTQVAPLVLYVEANTVAELAACGRLAGLDPIRGGRLTLAAFPSPITRRLSERTSAGIWTVPWPRAYADLRSSGVRGEGAAEHLVEVMTADG